MDVDPDGGSGRGHRPWGRWFALDEEFLGGELWLFLPPDNFMNGQDDAILGNAACPGARLTGQLQGGPPDPAALQGIWSEECFEKATGDLCSEPSVEQRKAREAPLD